MDSRFEFDGMEFEIESAVLNALIHDDQTIHWGIRIEAREKEIDGDDYWPALDLDFRKLKPRSYREFSNRTFELGRDLEGIMYGYDHQKLEKGSVFIGEFKDGHFDAKGSCTVEAETQCRFQCRLHFPGVGVVCSEEDTQASVLERAMHHLNLVEYRQGEIHLFRTLEDGSRVGICLFEPVTGAGT